MVKSSHGVASLKAASIIFGILEMHVDPKQKIIGSKFIQLRNNGMTVKAALAHLKISLKGPIMGTTVTPKYRVVIEGLGIASMCWDIKNYGRPSDANLERFVMAFVASLRPGGANAHLQSGTENLLFPTGARIEYNHRGGATVFAWKPAMFQVYESMAA